MTLAFLRVRRNQLLLGAAVLALVAAAAAAPLFLPKASQTVSQPLADVGAAPMLVKEGRFVDGEPAHHAEGRVAVYRGDHGHFLRFEGYDATAGPDVYFYLTPKPDARTTAEVEGGLRVLVPGGDDDGEATLRGDFNVPLPAGFDPAAYQGIVAWCDRFDVRFGSASWA